MKHPNTSLFFFSLLALSLFLAQGNSTQLGPELDDESEFNYAEGSGKGPEDWWHLKNDSWRTCKYGDEQSPIDLKPEYVYPNRSLGSLDTCYMRNHAILKNRGHDIMVGWPDGAGSLFIDGTEFTLKQCHWHSPAEHAIGGWRPDLEMHMVHQAPDNKTAVVGVLYSIGPVPDPFLSELMEPLKCLADGRRNNLTVGCIEPWKVKGPQLYYRYMGSLTTPPCTEGIVWTVLRKVASVSHEQVQLLRAAVHDGMENNARPLQLLNGRQIQVFSPWAPDEHPTS